MSGSSSATTTMRLFVGADVPVASVIPETLSTAPSRFVPILVEVKRPHPELAKPVQSRSERVSPTEVIAGSRARSVVLVHLNRGRLLNLHEELDVALGLLEPVNE